MSDQRYKEIVDLIREAFIAFDGGGRFVFVNRRAEELLGKESGFLVGRNFPEAFPDLLDRPFYHQLQRVFSEKVPLSLELDDSPFGVGAQIRSCPRPDGVWLFASEAAKERVAQALEEETAINGALLELDALRQSEERYRALFEQAGTGIAHVSIAGRFIEVNSKLCDILGYPREELLELTWQDITHPDDISLGGDNVERLLRRLASSFSLEKRYRRKDGSFVWAHLNVALIRDGGGEPQHLVSVVKDISARKRAEEELRVKNAALESSLNAVAIADLEGRLTYVNHSFLRLWGYDDPGEVLGLPAITFWQSPREAEEVLTAVLEKEAYTGELTALRRDGRPVEVLLAANKVMAGDGSPLCIMASFVNLSVRKKAERALAENETKFRTLFEESPISLWEEDFSALKTYLDQLREEGVSDYDAHFRAHPEALVESARRIRIIDVNRATVDLYGARSKKDLLSHLDGILVEESWDQFRDEVVALAGGATRFATDGVNQTLRGERLYVRMQASVAPGHEERLDKVLVSIVDMTERRVAEEKIEQLAFYDILTGLPNRRMLQDRLRQSLALAEREGHQVAVLYLDLDRFKEINDALGHSTGDQLLKAVAECLSDQLRRADTIARLGGDEFVILLPSINGQEGAAQTARKVLSALAAPFSLGSRQVYTGTSIGIALYPADGSSAEELLKHADIAMYHAKGEGRGNFQFFSQEINRRIEEILLLENSMRRALDQGEYFLKYQPQVDMASGRMTGVEALVRWAHPDLGLIGPERFIPQAEENGLIIPLGEWVLRTACAQVLAWQAQGAKGLRASVNVSGYQFRQPDFIDTIDRVLLETGLAPADLEIELTESAIMDKSFDTIMALTDLKVRGIRLAIDDFGTGYSSLSYLKHFPIDRIKIDRSFVHDIVEGGDGATISEAIIGMGNNLKIQVFAEGVETRRQAEFLMARKCLEAQGFYFAPPLSVEFLTEALRKSGESGMVFPISRRV